MRFYRADGSFVSIPAGTEETAKSNLSGKVLIALGDSYTVGMTNQFKALAKKFGMAIDNRGRTSSPIAYRPDMVQSFTSRADDIVTAYTNGRTIDYVTYHADDVAIITFMGGANDGSGDFRIGTGPNVTDNSKIYGALHHIFSVFQETFTKAKIICITQPTHYVASASGISTEAEAMDYGFDSLAQAQTMDDPQFSTYLQARKENVVKEMAWLYQIPVVDMFNEFPPVNNPTNRTTYWQSDKLHLTTAGYNLVADAIERKIVELFGQ